MPNWLLKGLCQLLTLGIPAIVKAVKKRKAEKKKEAAKKKAAKEKAAKAAKELAEQSKKVRIIRLIPKAKIDDNPY